jgi:membrane-bound lytic murein transglycosylase D
MISGQQPKLDSSDRANRRLPAIGVCCATLAVLLAACGAPAPRTVIASIPIALAPPVVAADPVVQTRSAPAQPASPWPRLRARYAMPSCDYSPAIHQFAAQMAASPADLSAAFKEAMPFLLLVTEQIEDFDMPGEFAFLPWVESSYHMLPARGKGVAGMWQLMPSTARANGLHVDAEYDGRLDAIASSRTALALLKHYNESFGDWRLANMAFNAGENGLRAAIGKHRALTSEEVSKLRLNRVNYEHLTKLLAIACIVSAPERYRVELPEPDADDVLAQLELPAPLDLHLAAKLAGMDFAKLQRLNPAYRKGYMPEQGPFHLLVPAARRATIEKTLGLMPQYAWRNWHEIRLQQPRSLDILSMAYAVDGMALAQINHVEANATLPAGTSVLLPGPGSDTPASAEVAVSAMANPPPASATPMLANAHRSQINR